MTKREWAVNQIKLQELIQSKLNINVLNCGGCGNVMFHEMSENFHAICECGYESDEPSDFPDFWYKGVEFNFKDEPIIKPTNEVTTEITFDDVVKVAMDLNLNPSVAEMKEVLKYYNSEADQDVTATWDLTVENLLYNCIAPKN